MAIVPNAEHAVIPLEKLKGYSLNTEHSTGKDKARVFKAALGLTLADAEWLGNQIAQAILTNDATEQSANPFGKRYVVDFKLTTNTGSAFVRTAWIIRHTEDFPRLTSCFITEGKNDEST